MKNDVFADGNKRIAATTIDTTPEIIDTQRLPLKNDNQSGSFVVLNLL